MLPGFVDRGPQVSDEDISAFEQRCGFPLTPDFREFLRVQNGGRRVSASELEEEKRTPEDVRAEIPPKHLFLSLGVAAEAGYSLDDVRTMIDSGMLHEFPELIRDLDVSMYWWRFLEYPPNLLPIAKTQYGENKLLMQLDAPDAGKVTFLYDPDGYCEWHCEPVANSMAELLDGFDRWTHA